MKNKTCSDCVRKNICIDRSRHYPCSSFKDKDEKGNEGRRNIKRRRNTNECEGISAAD